MGTDGRSRYLNGPVNMIWFGPNPAWMTYRRPTFLLPRRQRGHRFAALFFIRFKLPVVNCRQFGFKFHIFPFQKVYPVISGLNPITQRFDNPQMFLVLMVG